MRIRPGEDVGHEIHLSGPELADRPRDQARVDERAVPTQPHEPIEPVHAGGRGEPLGDVVQGAAAEPNTPFATERDDRIIIRSDRGRNHDLIDSAGAPDTLQEVLQERPAPNTNRP